ETRRQRFDILACVVVDCDIVTCQFIEAVQPPYDILIVVRDNDVHFKAPFADTKTNRGRTGLCRSSSRSLQISAVVSIPRVGKYREYGAHVRFAWAGSHHAG